MKFKLLLLCSGLLVACGNPVSDYPNMNDAQKAAYMAKYKKEMEKVYSMANRMGHMTTTHETDPVNDRITVRMKINQSMPGAEQAMATQIGDAMLERNCKERFMRDFWEAGITYTIIMSDKNNRTLANISVSPEKCAAFKR